MEESTEGPYINGATTGDISFNGDDLYEDIMQTIGNEEERDQSGASTPSHYTLDLTKNTKLANVVAMAVHAEVEQQSFDSSEASFRFPPPPPPPSTPMKPE